VQARAPKWILCFVFAGGLSSLLMAGEVPDAAALKTPGEPSSSTVDDVPAPSSSKPVTAKMRANAKVVARGGALQLTVRLRVAGGHHILPMKTPEPFIPTTLKLAPPDGLETGGDWLTPEPQTAADGARIYTVAVEFRRTLKVRPDAPVGTVTAAVELRYQACTDELCWPPESIPLSTTLTVQ
jgi:hypothetical protein